MAIKQFGKKGMFLTLISISIIAAVIIIFTPSGLDLSKNMPVIKTRVSNVNEYVLDLENVYLENALKATGRKTLIGLIGHVKDNGFFANAVEFENAFSEVLLHGEYNGNNIGVMDENTYNDWLNQIVITAKNTYNIDTTFSPIQLTDIQVYQIRPWFIEVEADITFSVTSETASWTRDVTIKTEISVENFDDPYYLVNTGGSYINKIRKSDTKFDEWDVDKVKDFITDGNYTHFENSNAPNFLMRFTNDISASPCCGIESLVNPNNPAITGKDVSYVDYKYWSATPTCPNPNLYTVNDITGSFPLFPNFKLDFNHVVLYTLLSDASLHCPP